MPGLVVFLHGLRGNQKSWGAVPDYVKKSPLSDDFAIATPTYRAKIWSPSSIETSAQQLITRLQMDYDHCDPIFLVGHSLGGLVNERIQRRFRG
jgi:pimeloyl-ACP methyl ester carboxylesterase